MLSCCFSVQNPRHILKKQDFIKQTHTNKWWYTHNLGYLMNEYFYVNQQTFRWNCQKMNWKWNYGKQLRYRKLKQTIVDVTLSTDSRPANWLFIFVFYLLLFDKVIDTLCLELEVTHRYLKGKYEALEILQGKVGQHTHADVQHLTFSYSSFGKKDSFEPNCH